MDSWRATDKLTVNLGLRYDLTLVPIYGDNGNANNFVGDLDARTGIYYIEQKRAGLQSSGRGRSLHSRRRAARECERDPSRGRCHLSQ